MTPMLQDRGGSEAWMELPRALPCWSCWPEDGFLHCCSPVCLPGSPGFTAECFVPWESLPQHADKRNIYRGSVLPSPPGKAVLPLWA